MESIPTLEVSKFNKFSKGTARFSSSSCLSVRRERVKLEVSGVD